MPATSVSIFLLEKHAIPPGTGFFPTVHKPPMASGRCTCYSHSCKRGGTNISEGTKYFTGSLEIFDPGDQIFRGSKYSVTVQTTGSMVPREYCLMLLHSLQRVYQLVLLALCGKGASRSYKCLSLTGRPVIRSCRWGFLCVSPWLANLSSGHVGGGFLCFPDWPTCHRVM